MSNLSVVDKDFLEEALNMGCGYVLDFSDRTFSKFFNEQGEDIDNPVYAENGRSKAKRLRAYWHLASDESVGKILVAMSEVMENNLVRGKVCSGDQESKEQYVGQARRVKEIGEKLLNRTNASAGKENAGAMQYQNDDVERLKTYMKLKAEYYGIPISTLFFDFSDISNIVIYTDGVYGETFYDEMFDIFQDESALKTAIRAGIGKEIFEKFPQNSEWTIKVAANTEIKNVVNNVQNNTINNSGMAKSISLSKNTNASPERKQLSICAKFSDWFKWF